MKEREKENEFARRLRDAIELIDSEKKERVRLEIENTRLRDALMEKTRALETSEKMLAEKSEALRKVEEELAVHKSVDEKIAEFDRELTKVEELKRGYEKRIAELETQLRRAEARLKSLKITLSESDLPDLVDVERPVRGHLKRRDKHQPEENHTVVEAETTAIQVPKTNAIQVPTKTTDIQYPNTIEDTPCHQPGENNADITDDWLMSLPDF